jgi:hypothetical protein
MRALLAMAAVLGFIMGGLYLGGGLLGVWDKIEPPAASKAAAALSDRSRGAHSAKRRRATKKVARKRRAARTTRAASARTRARLVKADITIARKAVLRLSDMGPGGWRRVPVSAEAGPGCAGTNPNVSRMRVTGTARSAFKGGVSQIESRVKLFTSAGDAARYFDANLNGAVLRCIRDGVRGALQRAGLRPRVVYARFQRTPRIGSRTAIYVVGYLLTLANGRKQPYPVDMLAFHVGRAVGVVSFTLVPSDDGSRPCSCELDEARLVASRLSRA